MEIRLIYISGLGFPMGKPLIQIAFLLLLPCLLVDYRSSPANEFKFYANLILHTLSEVVFVFAFVTAFVFETNPSDPDTRRKNLVAVILTVLVSVICVIFYDWTLELTNYLILCVGCAFYALILREIATTKYKYSKIVSFISVCLVVLMNDWKLTVDAIQSGTILWTFLHNICLHLVFGVSHALMSVSNAYFMNGGKPTWRSLYRWPTSSRELYLNQSFSLIFVTLYAPTTTTKVFDSW
jgi:hypothetical protein